MVNIQYNYMLSFLRVIKFAIQDIVRNTSLSFMTILILILMLLSINTFIIIRILTESATENIKNRIDVSIYFNHAAQEKQISEIRKYIESFPEVINLEFFTRDEVLQGFRDKYSGNSEIVSALEELDENPLGATLVIKTREPGDYEKIIKALSVPEYENIIESKTFADTKKVITKIDIITKQIEKFSIGISAFFALIAFIIIFNTVRVAIYTQRVEISIKKLVGATNWFVRGPYIIEGIIFSIVSTVITYAIMILISSFLDPYISVIFGEPQFLTSYFNSNILLLLTTQFVGVMALTAISSFFAMRKHLRA